MARALSLVAMCVAALLACAPAALAQVSGGAFSGASAPSASSGCVPRSPARTRIVCACRRRVPSARRRVAPPLFPELPCLRARCALPTDACSFGGGQQQQASQGAAAPSGGASAGAGIVGGYQVDRASGRRCFLSEADCAAGPTSCSASGVNRCLQGATGPCGNTDKSLGNYIWFCPS